MEGLKKVDITNLRVRRRFRPCSALKEARLTVRENQI